MKKFLPLFVLLGLTAALPAKAQDGLNLPPAGQTIINFSATETRTVPQDLLMASLRIEIQDATPVEIQKKINDGMKKALEIAKADASLKVSTGAYMVHKYEEPVDPRPAADGKPVKTKSVWRGSQTINIESKEKDKLLDVTGKIQALGFAMNNLQYVLSPDTAEKVRDELMVAALKKLQNKADIVAKTLGKQSYDLADVNVDGGGPIMPMYKNVQMMRAESAMADAGMPAPVAEAGETDVSVTVSARALIK